MTKNQSSKFKVQKSAISNQQSKAAFSNPLTMVKP